MRDAGLAGVVVRAAGVAGGKHKRSEIGRRNDATRSRSEGAGVAKIVGNGDRTIGDAGAWCLADRRGSYRHGLVGFRKARWCYADGRGRVGFRHNAGGGGLTGVVVCVAVVARCEGYGASSEWRDATTAS